MNLPQLVTDYGYVALAVGCLLEGETVLVMAGYAAHRGLLSWPMVFAVAAIFSFAGDQMWFQVGRHYGQRLIERFTLLRERLPWLQARVGAHPEALVLGIRFMVGLRTVGPILMGCGLVPPRRFLWLNLLGALLWVTVFASAGYFFGQVMETLLPRVKAVEEWCLGALALLGLCIHLWQSIRRKRHEP